MSVTIYGVDGRPITAGSQMVPASRQPPGEGGRFKRWLDRKHPHWERHYRHGAYGVAVTPAGGWVLTADYDQGGGVNWFWRPVGGSVAAWGEHYALPDLRPFHRWLSVHTDTPPDGATAVEYAKTGLEDQRVWYLTLG